MTAREIVAKLRKGEVYHIKKELFEKFKEEIVKHNLLDLSIKPTERLRVKQDCYTLSLESPSIKLIHNRGMLYGN